MEIGERIKSRRTQLGLSAEQLAEMVGVSPATIYRYESGDIKNMRVKMLRPIANALKTSPEWLMGWNSQGVLTWSMDFRFSEEESERIQEHFKELLLRYKKIVNAMADSKPGPIDNDYVRKQMNDTVSWICNMMTYIDHSLPNLQSDLECELLQEFNLLSDRDKVAWLTRIEDYISENR